MSTTRSLDWVPMPPIEQGAPPLSRVDEDAVVKRLLAVADDPVQRIGVPSVAAYKSLAESRGVSLEHVVRAACRGQLADVVRSPERPAQPTRKETER